MPPDVNGKRQLGQTIRWHRVRWESIIPNVFFISYARPRQGQPQMVETLDRFMAHLREAVGSLLTDVNYHQVGFRDVCNLDAGTPDWSADLTQQLLAYPVGLVLLSPAYVDTDRAWCKWECQFLARRNAAAAALPDSIAPTKPRLLLVLNWVSLDPRDMPEGFPQLTQGVGEAIAGLDAQDVLAVRSVLGRGLFDSLQLVQAGDKSMETAYQRFVQVLGRYIAGQWRHWKDLEAHQIDLGTPGPFVPGDTWRPASRPVIGTRHKVFVVYLAAQPGEVAPLAPDRAKRYQEDGGSDWQPFALADSGGPRVGDVVKKLEQLGISAVERWPFDFFLKSMPQALEEAGSRYPVVVVVDPWTATRLPQYGKALRKFSEEERKRILFALLVEVASTSDPDEALIRADFLGGVGKLFHHTRWQRHAGANDLELGLSLGVKLMQLNIRNARADKLSSTGSSPPRISGI